MPDDHYSSGHDDDLPRTVRQQQKEARARDQLARDMLNGPRTNYAKNAARNGAASVAANTPLDDYYEGENMDGGRMAPGDSPSATVTRLRLPFFHMMFFFIKAAVAAIPAIILIMLMIYVIGQAAQMYVPWLVKMKVAITFPG